MWSLMVSEPPLVTYKELMDGTYSIDDLIQMILVLKFKAKLMKDVPDDN